MALGVNHVSVVHCTLILSVVSTELFPRPLAQGSFNYTVLSFLESHTVKIVHVPPSDYGLLLTDMFVSLSCLLMV